MSQSSPKRALGASIGGRVRRLAVVFGDQLDVDARLLRELDVDEDAVLMMEVEQESTQVPSHRQRTVLFLAAMRHFALELAARGFRVRYVKLDARWNTQTLAGEIARAVSILRPSRLACTHPGDWRIRSLLDGLERDFDIPVDLFPDEHFTATLEEFTSWASERKQLVMEYFYRQQRKRLDVLVDADGKPSGGEWNFDKENRQRFRDAPDPPEPWTPEPDSITKEVLRTVQRRLPQAPGRVETFRWPVTRSDARRALEDFVEHRLPDFGRFQDAMWTDQPWLYHSLLSPCLNLKLLSAKDCVDAALDAWRAGKAPLNSVEGFIRQLIGWREFIRGVYWHEGPGYRERNELDHSGKLPEFYWSGDTDMCCLRQSLKQVIEHGYGHHIQRLMVTGNFALIAGIHPRAVADWYLGMYVDGVDWVTAPNTVGMVMHADGGVVGTKPYAASGRYIERMSDYCQGCRYDPKKRTGEGQEDGEGAACPFTTFYWDFLLRNAERFGANARMTMVLKNLKRLTASEIQEIRQRADLLRVEFGISETDSVADRVRAP